VRLVQFDYAEGMRNMAGMPEWLGEIILPLVFCLLTARYLLRALLGRHPAVVGVPR